MHTSRMVSRAELRTRLLPIALTQVVGLLCGLVGVRLTTHLVEPAHFGLYGIFTSLAPAGMWVVFAGMNSALLRHWAAATNRPALLRTVLEVTFRKTGWLVVVAAATALLATREHWAGFAVLLFVAILGLGLTQYAHSIQQAARQHWRDFSLSAVGSVSRTALPPLFYVLGGAMPLALPTGFVLHVLLSVTAGAWLLRRHLRPAVGSTGAELPSAYHGSLFFTLAVAGWVLGGSNRWLTTAFYGAEVTGYFSLASNIAVILPSMLGTMLMQYLQPAWFAAGHTTVGERRQLAHRVDRAAAGYTALALGMAVALHFAMPLFVGPLVSVNYLPALDWVLGAGCFTVAVTTGRFYNSLLFAAKRETACRRVELTATGGYLLGGLTGAAAGAEWFQHWLVMTPLVPWLVNRPLAHRVIFPTA